MRFLARAPRAGLKHAGLLFLLMAALLAAAACGPNGQCSAPGPGSPPALTIGDGVVYVAGQGTLHALRAGSGTELWHTEGLPITAGPRAPVLAAGVLYSTGPALLPWAVRAADGTLLWSASENGAAGVFTPLGVPPPAIAEGVVSVGAPDGAVSAYRATDGQLLWHAPHPAPLTFSGMNQPAVVPAVVVEHGVVYGGSGAEIYALRVHDGTVLWHAETKVDTLLAWSQLTVAEGVVYVNEAGRALTARDATDGHILWSTPTASGAQLTCADASFFPSQPLVAADMIYATGSDGSVYALSTRKGVILWHASVPDCSSAWPLTIVSVSGGLVFARVGPSLYALHAGGIAWSTLAADGVQVAGDVVVVSAPDAIAVRRTADGTLLWQQHAGSAALPPAVFLAGDVVYATTAASNFCTPGPSVQESILAWRLQDGALLWRHPFT